MRPHLKFHYSTLLSLTILGKMHHTADGQNDRYCILFIKFENNVNQMTEEIQIGYKIQLPLLIPGTLYQSFRTHNSEFYEDSMYTILRILFGV